MPILNYTTQIDADKTAGEISRMLSLAGASAVLTEYNKEHNFVEAISFKIEINGNPVSFKLPTDWRPILTILNEDPKVPGRLKTNNQAVRVAWRIIKDWVEAQLAIIETKMVKTEEVFLPYAIMKDGKTFFESSIEKNLLN